MPKKKFQIYLRLYTCLGRLLLPLFLGRLFYRSLALPAYRRHLAERFGFARLPQHAIWVHAVSVGETKAASPLIQSFLALGKKVALTQTTPTARKIAETMLPTDSFAYLPFDDPFLIRRFIKRFQPKTLIIMETELWPNLLVCCHTHKIPVFVANARLSKKSTRRYARFRALTQALLPPVTIFAQSRKDAKRFQYLGARKVEIAGNLKFDAQPAPDVYEKARFFRSLIKNRFIICAASTRPGEEKILLKHLSLLSIPNLLFVIIPRHPERFAEVEDLLRKEKYIYQKRSDESPIAPETKIWLGDSMGELYAYYGAADIAIIGGSIMDFGGQNPIEAMAMGVPVTIGPYTEHFSTIVQKALKSSAILQATSPPDLKQLIEELFKHPEKRQQLSKNGLDFWQKEQGATRRIVEQVSNHFHECDKE